MTENKNTPTNGTASNIVRIIILLAIISAVFYAISTVNKSLRSALNPLEQANNALSTQVADLLHPTPTIIPDPNTYIHEIKAIARLETIRYSVEKVITAEVNQGIFGPLFGDRLLFIAHGYVIAGIDMEKINEGDLWMEGDILFVRLPAAEILDANIDNEKSYVYDRDLGIFTKGNQDLETEARQAAVLEIRKAAEQDGILVLAMQNAETYLEKLFNALGFEKVNFITP